jgi:spore germination protein GerM
VREAREIDPCPGVVECAEEVVTELINGPLGDFSPTLPETATFRGITLDGDMLTVDFGRELRDGLTGGSTAEALAVYSVVNSLVANFPTVKRVRFLVEGQGVTTLAGHLDLRDPLEADFLQEQGQQRATAAPAAQGVKR